jgi:hypothetical protein
MDTINGGGDSFCGGEMARAWAVSLYHIQNAWNFLSTPCIPLHILLPRHRCNFNLTYFILPPIACRFSKFVQAHICFPDVCYTHHPSCLDWIFIALLSFLSILSSPSLFIFSLCHCSQLGSGAHPASYPMGSRCFPSGVKRPGREADHSPPSSAKV